MRFASLGSGSQGNGLVVAAGDTVVLVDCGFSQRGTVERLARLGLAPGDLSAVLVTHEHSDHLSGVFPLARRHALPVYLTHGTWEVAKRRLAERAAAVSGLCRNLRAEQPFMLGSLEVHPFPVPHDAREPVQFTFAHAGRRLGVLTDCGWVTPHALDVLRPCDALVLEFNHDADRLAVSSYPPVLRQRIAGEFGHLENGQALGLLDALDAGRLQHLLAAHLSAENNCPQLVGALLAQHPSMVGAGLGVACQENGSDWREIV